MGSSSEEFWAWFFCLFSPHQPSCHGWRSSPNESLVQTLHRLSNCLGPWKFHAMAHNKWHSTAVTASHTIRCSHVDSCSSSKLPGCLKGQGIVDPADSVPKCPHGWPGETLDFVQGGFRKPLHEVFPPPPFSERTDHCLLCPHFTIP